MSKQHHDAAIAPAGRWNAHTIRQTVKWIVYCLLLINFAGYAYEEWVFSRHTLPDGASFLEWTEAFATTIDELGWFMLLALFELETYVLSDEALEGAVERVFLVVRGVCYAMLAHSVYAFGMIVIDLTPTYPATGIDNLCQLAEADVSYNYNLEYTEVTAANCAELSSAAGFFYLDDGAVVTDRPGLRIERELAWVDWIEVIVWLIILATIELVVWLQNRNVTGGVAIHVANYAKIGLYGILVLFGIWWAWLGHWMYAWDEFVWIAGFAAIEMNVAEWREELVEEGH